MEKTWNFSTTKDDNFFIYIPFTLSACEYFKGIYGKLKIGIELKAKKKKAYRKKNIKTKKYE